ncbi:hypothetical protein BH09PLA1_BH09PLA1_37730 [soil metagenome]
MTEAAEIEIDSAPAEITVPAEIDAPAQPSVRVHLPDRKLPSLIELEPLPQRMLWLIALAIILSLYAFTLKTFWAPADGGVDQNAYLVGGKQRALHGSTRVDLAHPFEYVGAMLVVASNTFDGAYYPKYPFGQSILFAIPQIMFGRDLGVKYAFAVNPICAVLAVAGTFFLARTLAGSFPAILAAILLATCPVMLVLANGANSHPSSVAFAVWGMFFLVRWWQTNSIWRGIAAGFLLAGACLVRYSEGLLILPILAAAVTKLRWRDWRSYVRTAVPALAWAVPVAILLIYNKRTLGDWTGYDSSKESELGNAFTWENFVGTWPLMLRTFHDMALFFTLPLGVVGLIMLFARSVRAGVVMLAWLLPGVALYTSYYWAPERGVSYARFFLTFFPALLVGFAVCVRFGILRIGELDRPRLHRIVMPIAAGAVVAIAASIGTLRAIQNDDSGGIGGFAEILPAQLQGRLSLANAGQMLRQRVKTGDVVFTEDVRGPNGATNYLAFAIDGRLFTFNAFEPGGGSRGARFGNQNPDAPTPQQPRRREVTQAQYAGKTDRNLITEQNQVTDEAIASGQNVFLFGSQSSIDSFRRKFLPNSRYEVVTVDRWKDPPSPREQATTQPARRNRGGGAGNAVRNLIPGGTRINDWRLAEVRQKSAAPSTRPATVPALHSATSPASTQP